MRLIWIRHGETIWNREFRLQGTSDVALSDIGLKQAEQLAAGLQEKPVKLFVSPLSRTMSFAKPLSKCLGLIPHMLDDLRELSFGRWEGLRYQDMDDELRGWFERWCIDPVNVCPPDGESTASLAARVWSAVDHIHGKMGEGETAAIVTHGGVVRVAVTELMGMRPEAAGRLSIDPGSVTITDYVADHWRLVRLNDIAHLREDC
jgi:broad specificity phosphatase PhoE